VSIWSDFGSNIESLIENMFLRSLEYFADCFSFDCRFQNVKVHDFEIKEVEGKVASRAYQYCKIVIKYCLVTSFKKPLN
jgi:hypothetical protein